MEKTFRSKIDWWLFVLLIAFLGIQLYVLIGIVPRELNGLPGILTAAAVVLAFLLVASILLRTRYRVYGEELKIVCGPFRWTIKIADITSVTETRNPLSSPALSLDRIRINYGSGRWVMVSPADKRGFYASIGQQPTTN